MFIPRYKNKQVHKESFKTNVEIITCRNSSLTILLCTERVQPVSLIVWACGAPELPIRASVWGAGIISLSHEDKRECTRLAVRVTTVCLVSGLYTHKKMYIWWIFECCVVINELLNLNAHQPNPLGCFLPFLLPFHYLPLLTVLLAADSVAQTGTDHLLTALVSEPALCVFVDDSGVNTACALGSVLGLLLWAAGGRQDSTCGLKKDRVKIVNAEGISIKLSMSF